MGYQSEAVLEENLIKKLVDIGYERVVITDYDKLVDNFRIQINKFNKNVLGDVLLSDSEFLRLMNYLSGKSVFQCAKQLRDKYPLERDDGTTAYLSFLSQYDTENIYQVTNQVTVEGKYKNRYDVTLLCNGLPIVQIELKRPGIDVNEAINQIDRYRIHSYKGLFHYVQMFVVSNSVETRYFANTDQPRIQKSLTFYWTDEVNQRINILSDFTNALLNTNRLNKMINKYMVISEYDKALMIFRPYQVFATEALLRKAIDTNKGGYIFHTTGSGKTLTSFKCAQLLCKEEKIKKVIFLVDRADLDNQTMMEFNRFEEGSVDTTDRTDVLVKQIKDKNIKLICTTIQKMANAVKNPRYASIMEQWADQKIVLIFDECHRSQFGKMHTDIKKHFKNAQYFGFTGTPRFPQNKSQDSRTTADVFGECLHSYMIKEAIFDRNVLGFNVEYISTYDGQYDEDDATLVEDINKTEVLEAPERVTLITQHIADHWKTKARIGKNKYTAIFATSSIDMLVRYYDEFKKIDHGMKIAAVFSYGANEDISDKEEHSRDQLERIIKDYNKMFDTAFTTDTFAAYNADIQKRLKVKKTPEIDLLIVVDMYLTGFDSKPLNTLYVDKNLQWHNLLQAFSRTNRVEKETKQFGNIVCYRNLKKKTDDALKLFSGGGDISGILLEDYDFYVKRFKALVDELHKYIETSEDIDKLESEEDQKRFVIAFRELSKCLLTLETFTEFVWDDINDVMQQQEYENIKGRYTNLYDKIKKDRKANQSSILDDIDFKIELVETDRINVAYIMNLLRNVDLSDPKQRDKEIEHIYDELERTDSDELRRKVDLIKSFIEQSLVHLQPGDSVDDAYAKFEDEQRENEIIDFATTNNVDRMCLKSIISEYEFSGMVDESRIDKELCKNLGFRERRQMRQKTIMFISENCLKYMN